MRRTVRHRFVVITLVVAGVLSAGITTATAATRPDGNPNGKFTKGVYFCNGNGYVVRVEAAAKNRGQLRKATRTKAGRYVCPPSPAIPPETLPSVTLPPVTVSPITLPAPLPPIDDDPGFDNECMLLDCDTPATTTPPDVVCMAIGCPTLPPPPPSTTIPGGGYCLQTYPEQCFPAPTIVCVRAPCLPAGANELTPGVMSHKR